MRKEIRKFLEITSKEYIKNDTIATQHLEEIVKVYSDSLLSESTCQVLSHRFESDVSDLLVELSRINRYYEGDKSVVELLWFIPEKNKEAIRNSALNIQNFILSYVSYMAELGYFLSDKFIKHYGIVSMGAFTFGEIAPKPNYLIPEPQQGQTTPEGDVQAPDTTPEPQQDTIEAQQGQITPEGNNTTPEPPQVPTINNTDRERWVYGIALDKDYMIQNENNTYTWKKDKVLLAYMCGRLYCSDRVISNGTQYLKGKKGLPNTELSKLFNITTREGIGGNRDNIKEYAPPKDYNLINDIFKEVEEKTGIK